MNIADIAVPQTKESHPEPRPGFVWSNCYACGKDFETKDIIYPSKNGPVHLKAGKCRTCDEMERSKEHRDKQDLMFLQREWTQRCPAEYADTDTTRIDRRNWQIGLGWVSGVKMSGTGLVIGGPPRKRKTRMAWMLLKEIHFKLRMKWDAFLWSKFMSEIADAYKVGEDSVESMVVHACNVPVLFIDDLAQDAATHRTGETAKRIIEERTTNHRPTIITMNASGEELVRRYGEFGEQIKGRLTDYFTVVAFK